MNFNTYINKLSKKDKFLVILIVPLICFLLFRIVSIFLPSHSSSTINQITKKSNTILQNTQYSSLNTIKYIEQLSQKLHLHILLLNINNKIYQLQIEGSFKDIFHFLYYIEHSMQINSLDITQKKNIFILKLNLKFIKQNFKPTNNNFLPIPNPFIQYKHTKHNTIKKQHIQLKLTAIISQQVLINNKWYNKGDMIQNYKIKHISTNSVTLTKDQQIKILKVYSDD